jgi:hypothetical protein
MRRGINKLAISGEKMGAGGRALAAGNGHRFSALRIHPIDAVALLAGLTGLKREPRAVKRPISLRVLSSVGKPVKLAEVNFLRKCQGRGLLHRGTGCDLDEKEDEDEASHDATFACT